VRHYHRCGLLAEPARDAAGYRRYDAQAVVDLVRIKTLAGAGVPLARVQDLLQAGPEEFAAAIAEIGQAQRARIREFTARRRRIAELAAGERLFLPPEITGVLDEFRALGTSERGMRAERDGWILVTALAPGLARSWAGQKRAALDDPEFRRLYLACDESYGWDPADPRLEPLARWIVDWSARRMPGGAPSGDQPPALSLMGEQVAAASPGWQRLGQRCAELAAAGPAGA
jgi:DNA-binding transcriptional MerR regulator